MQKRSFFYKVTSIYLKNIFHYVILIMIREKKVKYISVKSHVRKLIR